MAKRNHGADSWWQAHRPTTRRLVQLYAALLHNAHIRGFIEGKIYEGKGKYVCVPGLNCYSCPGAAGACPLGAVQNALAGAGHRAGWYVLGILLLFGVVLGRTICGWLCPMGLIQEVLYKIPVPKIRKSRFTRVLSRLKYVILAVFAVAIPLWFGLSENLPVPGFCKYICPITMFLKPASYFSFIRVKCDHTKCINCKKCIRNCPMNVDMLDDSRKRKNGTECIM